MRLSYKHIIILIVIFVLFSVSAYAQTNRTNLSGGYYFTQGQDINPDSESQESITSEDWKLISFWDLPLWVKIASIPTILISIAGMLVSVPFIIGKLRSKITKLKKGSIEESIKKYIGDNPDCSIAEIASDHQLSRGKVRYYLNNLLSHSKIVFYRIGKFTRLSINKGLSVDSVDMDNDKTYVLTLNLRNEKKKQFLYAILDKPGITNQDLSSWFNMDKSTIHDYLNELYREGLIEFVRDGKFKRCYVNPEIKALLAQL
jgi:predicted transcriptional regulator